MSVEAIAAARARLKENIDRTCGHLPELQRAEMLETEWTKLQQDPCADIRAHKARRAAREADVPGVQSPRGAGGTGRKVRRDFSGEEL
jgi:hypothetical protein